MSYVRVWAGGPSPWRIVSGGQPTLLLPGVPRNVSVVATTGELLVSWSPPWDPGGVAVSGYQVTIAPNDAPSVTVAGNARLHAFMGLTNGTQYTITVAAINVVGTGSGASTTAAPSGAWVIGSVGPRVGAPAGWGGNGGVDNGRGYYGATEPPPGVTNGAQMGPDYCGVLPVLKARGKGYADLTVVNTPGTLIDGKGLPSGTVTVDATGLVGVTVTRAGALLQYLDIRGQISVNAANVTIQFCRIDTRDVVGSGKYAIRTLDSSPGTIIAYTEIISGYAISAVSPTTGRWTMRYLDVWNVAADAFKVGTDCLVEFCWSHHMKKAPAAHADNVQWVNGDNIAVRFNRLEMIEAASENTPGPEVVDMGNGVQQVGQMSANGSWYAMDDNYGDGSNYLFRVGQQSPITNGTGTYTIEHAWWRRNRCGLRFIGGPVLDDTQASADQHFDETNVWHQSGRTYHRSTVNKVDTWYVSEMVVADAPVSSWRATHLGVYAP